MMQPHGTARGNRALLFALSLLLAGGLLVPVHRARAQDRPSPALYDVAIDPLDLLAQQGPLNLQYEWETSPVNSWVVRAHYWSVTPWGGFGAGAAYRFYIADSRALNGLSVAPAADIFFLNDGNLGHAATDVWLGGDLGYKWIFNQFSVEPLIGLRIGFAAGSPASNLGASTGGVAQISVYLGYAW